jgi:hypothetical protein
MNIRKISIGPDYKNAMHYVMGQEVLRGAYTIHLITFNNESTSYEIWIENDENEIILWKGFSNTVPVSIEYNIDF